MSEEGKVAVVGEGTDECEAGREECKVGEEVLAEMVVVSLVDGWLKIEDSDKGESPTSILTDFESVDDFGVNFVDNSWVADTSVVLTSAFLQVTELEDDVSEEDDSTSV